MLLIALTEADSTLNLRSLQIDSAECLLLAAAAGCACGHEPGDGARHRSCVCAPTQTKAMFLFIFKHALDDQNNIKKI